MSPLVNDAEHIIVRFENKKVERGFSFSPPPEKAAMGEFAFAQDVLNVILIGVVSGLLKDIVVFLLKAPIKGWRSSNEPTAAESVVAACEEVFEKTRSLEEGIRKLTQQGIRAEEARVAMDLLKEALGEELLEASAADTGTDTEDVSRS